jgi:hypothetical protein
MAQKWSGGARDAISSRIRRFARRVVATALTAFVAAVPNASTFANDNLSGLWISVSLGYRLSPSAVSETEVRTYLMTIEHDRSSGEVRTSGRPPPPGLLLASRFAYDPNFIGEWAGEVAVGFAREPAAAWCPSLPPASPARLRYRRAATPLSDPRRGAVLEIASPIVGSPQCNQSPEASLEEDAAHPLYSFVTFQRLYIVRKVRFLEVRADGSAGEPITAIEQGQEFQIEVEFELPPPAEVEVMLRTGSGLSYVVVWPTDQADIFRSEPRQANWEE